MDTENAHWVFTLKFCLKVGLKTKSTFKGQFFQSSHIFDYGVQSFHFWT